MSRSSTADGKSMTLQWHHTEFGRRTECGTYRVVHRGAGWQLLDADWNPLADAVTSVTAAQQLAQGLASRAAAKRDLAKAR